MARRAQKTMRRWITRSALGIATATLLMTTPAGAEAPLDESATEATPIEEAAGATPASPTRVALRTLRRIVIDPGHGQENEGAVGVGEVHEKHLTLPLAMHLADRLRARYPSLDVVLTRHRDDGVGLVERAEVANALDADLLISVHLNAAGNIEATGYETFWIADTLPPMPREIPSQVAALDILETLPARALRRARAAERSASFSRAVHAALGARLEAMDRGSKRANFTILRYAEVPAVVVEFGFLTHAEEGLRLQDPGYQATLIDALVSAIEAHDDALSSATSTEPRGAEVPSESQIRF